MTPVRIGFLPLSDAAVLVAAAEQGFAAAEGLALVRRRRTCLSPGRRCGISRRLRPETAHVARFWAFECAAQKSGAMQDV